MKTVFDIKEMQPILHQEAIGHSYYFGERNKAWASGILEGDFEYSHSVQEDRFYKNRIITATKGGQKYLVPIIISENFLYPFPKTDVGGLFVEAAGEFRSRNVMDEKGKSHLSLFLFSKYINICENVEELQEGPNANVVYLEGTICKPPVHRLTPLSKKRITDVFIAVGRQYRVSDYIPTIVWNVGAVYVKYELGLGNEVRFLGSIHNRIYLKRFPDSDRGEYREAYELSAMWIEKK